MMYLLTKEEGDIESGAFASIDDEGTPITLGLDIKVINKWPKESFSEIQTDKNTALIALTHDPKIDDPALQFAMTNNFFYIGALGSKKTHANRCQRLAKANFSKESIDKIYGPIGVKLGGKSAPEIALSITAQLVSEVYKKK